MPSKIYYAKNTSKAPLDAKFGHGAAISVFIVWKMFEFVK